MTITGENNIIETANGAEPTAVAEEQVSGGAERLITGGAPYRAFVTVRGTAPLLFHAWNVESVEEKARAAKNSATKKTDDVESYVYRNPDGFLGVPGKNMHAAIAEAGRYMPDPRSPRKSARDLLRAGIVPLSVISLFEPTRREWDYLDRQRVTVQRAGVTRTRPAMLEGWVLTFELLVSVPEYVSPTTLHNLITQAGKLCGLCDFRPTYGRFQVDQFRVEAEVLGQLGD